MTQASQQLPSWLTLTSTVLTEPDGSLSTSFATLRLPLTYYGPSIPLGTDGIWTYGGLTPPPTVSPLPTSPAVPPTTTPISTTSPPSSATPTVQSATSSSAESSLLPRSSVIAPSPSSSFPATNSPHGISTAVLGAILGSILGVMLLLILMLTLCLIRRNMTRRHRSNPEAEETNTSSFWNRQTTLFTLPWRRDETSGTSRRSTPIWTGWEVLNPEGTEENGRAANRTNDRGNSALVDDGSHTPGEGSPRGSGEEADPFLTRHNIRDAGFNDEKTQTRSYSDTLVSVPTAAAQPGGGSVRSSPQRTGHIIPRDVQMRIAEEVDARTPYSIRVVEATPSQDYSPLLPPPPLNPDGVVGLSAGSTRRHSDKSLESHRTQGLSLHSEKSIGSLDADPAELLVARRVRVGELGQQHERLPTIESETDVGGPSSRGLGLTGLTGRLGRLSWFKRFSSGATRAGAGQDFTIDPYTRTPPRSSRNGSHPRPGSWSRLPDNPDFVEAPNRHSRNDSGLGLSYLIAGSRPISGVSARSQTTTSGNTVYFDAQSRPATPRTPATPVAPTVPSLPRMEFPMPVTSPEEQALIARSPVDNRVTLSDSYRNTPANPPPAYDDRSLSRLRGGSHLGEIDVLDLPAPAPSSTFSSSRPAFPPADNRDSARIDINIEDDPPVAQESWRDLAAERDGRRRTFGTHTVVEPTPGLNSQHPSVYSVRSHLRPEGDRSGSRSDPSSNHSQGGSHSSRPSTHSQLVSVGSDHSYGSIRSIPEEGHPDEIGELRSPPLSAVLGSFGSSRPSSTQAPPPSARPDNTYVTPASSRAPLLGGTVTSSTTIGTNTNSSVTTALTDPITGAVMHFPSLPWARGQDPAQPHDLWHEPQADDDDNNW